MSAIAGLPKLSRTISAFGGKADALEGEDSQFRAFRLNYGSAMRLATAAKMILRSYLLLA